MPGKRSTTNPFYALLIVFGVAFALSACAYSVMTLKAVRPLAAPDVESPGTGLLVFMDHYGARLMAGELALLALATFAAIATDRYRMRRAYDEHQAKQAKQPPHESRPHPP